MQHTCILIGHLFRASKQRRVQSGGKATTTVTDDGGAGNGLMAGGEKKLCVTSTNFTRGHGLL